MKLKHIICLAALSVLCACNGNKGWQVSGNIANAPEASKLAVEGFNGGAWYTIDSLDIAPNGSFAYKAADKVQYPDIYRLSLNGRAVYFPIYDAESIVINADAFDFEGSSQVQGGRDAATISEIDKRIRQQVADKGIDQVLADSVLKAELNNIILADTVGIIGYYVFNKSIGGKPLYVPTSKRDVAMLGALAQKFSMAMPDDPRTQLLSEQFINARRMHAANGPTIQLEGDGFIEIELYDEKGQPRKLSETVAQHPIVLLSFTDYGLESSLAYNAELNKAVEAYKNKGIEVYQVSVDNNEVSWRESAINLPWITVRHNPTDSEIMLRHYNVGVLPLTYVIANGVLVERVIDPTELIDAIRKHQ